MKLNKAEVASLVLTGVFVLLTAFTLLFSSGSQAALTIDLSRPPEISVPASSAGETPALRININTATAEELTDLPGIGEALAARILTYREENGPFSDISELMQVSGIGAATFEGLKARITTGN